MTEKVGIIGSGIVGRSWAMLFAGAGYKVVLYDIEKSQVDGALKEIAEQLKRFEQSGLIRGNLNAKKQIELIGGTSNLKECVANAIYLQECVPEVIDLKLQVAKEIDAVVGSNTIIGSSTSTFLPSRLSKDLKNKENFIVAHPVNPVYFVPMVEVVPAPWTKPEVFQKTRDLMNELGEVPVCLNKEIEGFALNRIQYAILNECWNLVTNGYLSVKDMDNVMSKGLGMRYAFIGPLETAHLNAFGMKDYCDRYSKTIHEVSMTLAPVPKFEGPGVEEINRQLEAMVPLDKLKERCNWRNDCLAKLSQLKKEMGD